MARPAALSPGMMDNFRMSYNVTRYYPYRWMTPLVIVGAFVAIGIVTFINVVTESYDLVATSTDNATDIIKNGGTPYAKSPILSYFTKNTQATCASTTLPINSEIWTLNYAIPYTIGDVWQLKPDGTRQNLGSLVYLNNPLLDCNVTSVRIDVTGKYTQSPLLTARSRVGFVIKPFATCAIEMDETHPNNRTYFNLQGTYNWIDGDIPHFRLTNETSAASLYYGQSLLSLYYAFLAKSYYTASYDDDWGANGTNPDTYQAYIELLRNSTSDTGSDDEVKGLDFFTVNCFTEANFCANHSIPWLMQGDHQFDPYPSIWTTVDTLGKAMWFTVMTDLGQNKSAIPNMLAYPDLLANLTANVTNEVKAWQEAKRLDEPIGTTMDLDYTMPTTSFDPSASPQPALGAKQSFLSTNYICQVPKPKSIGTRVFAILIADFVLLQVIWQLFKLVLDHVVLGRGDPTYMYCEGCVGRHIVENSMEPMRDDSVTILKGGDSRDGWRSPDQSVIELNSYREVDQRIG